MIAEYVNQCKGPLQAEKGGAIWEWIHDKHSIENIVWVEPDYYSKESQSTSVEGNSTSGLIV